jgi:hypothetical protein
MDDVYNHIINTNATAGSSTASIYLMVWDLYKVI